MTTITRERLLKIQSWRETYGPGSNIVLPAEEAEQLARIALASLSAEPVRLYRERNPYNGMTTGWQELTQQEYEFVKDNASENAEFRTVYTAPPAPVVPEDVPATLRDEIIDLCDGYEIGDVGAQEIWSACRLFMIQGESLPALV
ncbi:hypothetical protein ACEWTF_001952 [Salmonella enterica]